MATFPAPAVPVFSSYAGYPPRQADFTTWWYNTASFLQNRVVFRARQATTATSLPSSGAATTIGYDTVDEDPYAGWNAGTHSWGPPAGYSGWYQVAVTLFTVALAAAVLIRPGCSASGAANLAAIQGAAGHAAGAEGQFTVYLTGGQDSVQGQGSLQNSGVAVNTSLTAGQQSSIDIVWLGTG
jgi:hypothetical protein